MGFRFRKRVRILPGVTVNISKKGVTSTTFGRRGFTTTVGKRGTRVNAGIPGTGLSYSKQLSGTRQPQERKTSVWSVILTLVAIVFLVALCTGGGDTARAHPGGLDSEGCHVCRSNCAWHGLQDGDRHCHGEPNLAADELPPLAEPEQVEPDIGPEILELNYTGGFTIWLDCSRRGAVRFRYNAQHDEGDLPRHTRFYLDPDVLAHCQQTSTASYRRPDGGRPTFDRGHLVPANHMTSILPRVAQMNRGAWYHTEVIVQCYRVIDELLVLGGVIRGDDPSADYFLESHGVATPDAYWKVVIRGDGRAIGWIVPNSAEATYRNLDRYPVSLREVEELTGETLPVEDFWRDEVPESSWVVPQGCDRS